MTKDALTSFSGATLGKCLNRGLATLAAGALGVGAHHLASLSGHIGEPILLGFLVFLQGEHVYSPKCSISVTSQSIMYVLLNK